MSDITALPIITEPVRDRLNRRQLVDYREQREACLDWLLTFGKNPDQAQGYAFQTVKNRAYRMDMFYRWVWDTEGRYTAAVTHDHADSWLRALARQNVSNVHKDNCRKALQMLFKWRHHEHGRPRWTPNLSFATREKSTAPRDYLTAEERTRIGEAALEYGSIPGYSDLTPSERDRWKRYLAQRFMKPKQEVTPDDWERANGWKIPSLVWTSLDAGLRPIEVERSVTGWVDTENGVLRIPKEQSSKNRENWVVGLRDRTTTMLDRWLDERDAYPMYDQTDALWLTRERNPYQSGTLRYLLHRLCDIADISTENRQLSWYALRHSTGTYMTREEDLAAAQMQLRHKSSETTMKYDQAPVEDRKDALDRID